MLGQDSLHTINDIFNSIEQLKIELKPEPKSDVEKYGVIIGASIALAGTLLTLILTLIKDVIFNNRAKKKEDLHFIRALYGDIMGIHMEYIRWIQQLDFLKIERMIIHAKLKASDGKDGFKELLEDEKEIFKKYEETYNVYSKLHKDYISKVGQYMITNKKSIVDKQVLDFATTGLRYKPEPFPLPKPSLSDLITHEQFLKVEYQKWWQKNVNSKSSAILESIKENR